MWEESDVLGGGLRHKLLLFSALHGNDSSSAFKRGRRLIENTPVAHSIVERHPGLIDHPVGAVDGEVPRSLLLSLNCQLLREGGREGQSLHGLHLQ